MATPTSASSWIYGISDAPLSSYTADSSTPASLVKFVTADRQAAEISVKTANNEGHATGHDWAEEQWTEAHDVNVPFNIDPTVNMLKRLLNAAFGSVVTTQPAAGVEKDVFTPMGTDTSRQLPSYWLAEKCTDDHDMLFPSCVLEKATFKGAELGKLNVAGNFRGSGRVILDEGLDFDAETQKYYFKNTMSNVVRATAAVPGTPVETYACGLQEWMFDVDNAPSESLGYDPGCANYYTTGDEDSGIVRSHHLFGTRKYGAKFTIWMPITSPEFQLLRDQTALNIRLKMTGSEIAATGFDNYVQFEMHLAYYSSVVLGEKDGFVTMEITPDAFYDASANKIVSVELQYPTIV